MLEESLQAHFAKIRSKQEPLLRLREDGWNRFQSLKMPDKKTEAFRYIPLSQLYAGIFKEVDEDLSSEVSLNIFPECQESHLVFINGIFAPHISKVPPGVIALPLHEAMATYGHFLQNRFVKSLQEEKDPFASLNAALHSGGAFIYILPKTVLKCPLQCHSVFTEGYVQRPRIHLFVGAHAEVDWISTIERKGTEGFFVSSVFDVAIEEGASFRSTELYNNLSESDWVFASKRATLKKNSRFREIGVTAGAKALRQDAYITLLGERAEATLQGIAMLKGHAQSHTYVVMDHKAPNCRSMQLFKGVLKDNSRSSFEGKIHVRKEAQKTEAYQLNKYLLLGERVLANSKPNLEIFADDVKASHGATMSQVNAKELFYLKSRGIPENEAKDLLVHGFCKEMIDQIPQKFVREIV